MAKGFTANFTMEEYLLFQETFSYNPISGNLVRKVKSKSRNNKGSICGSNHNGYLRLCLFGKAHLVHRICWVLYYGFESQPRLIDHEDGNGSNNKLENLRVATYEDNNHNSCVRKDSSTGIKGVIRNRTIRESYYGIVKSNKQGYYLGNFDTREEAEMAVITKRAGLHGEFANNGEKK